MEILIIKTVCAGVGVIAVLYSAYLLGRATMLNDCTTEIKENPDKPKNPSL